MLRQGVGYVIFPYAGAEGRRSCREASKTVRRRGRREAKPGNSRRQGSQWHPSCYRGSAAGAAESIVIFCEALRET